MMPEVETETFKNLKETFNSIDYAVFALMLVVSLLVGLYFGYQHYLKKDANATLDYLLGGKKARVFPVAMSLVATFVSGISLIGTSTEIYVFGTQFVFSLVSPLIMAVFMHFVIIPVFYDLNVVSMNEYLQRRFDKRMRLLGSLVSFMSTIFWLPIVIYVPALAFNQTTGIDIHVITPAVVLVCVFYTCLGGIEAVIWTDVIQAVFMYGIMALIIIKGTLNVGGLDVILERNWDSGRIEAPDFRFDPTIRHSFWSIVLGGTGFWIVTNVNQMVIQRFLSLKSKRAARQASIIFAVAVNVLLAMCMFVGLLMYATFHDCDPFTTKLAKAKDQLVPLLAMQTLKDYPGLLGLFIAGVFSAALSSMSSALNAMSAIVLEDYCKPFFKNGISQRASAFIMRGTVVVIGLISVGLVYVVELMGPVLQLTMSVPASTLGSIFGAFVIGMFAPWIGSKATFLGTLFGSAGMIYVVVRAELDMASGLLRFEEKVTSVEGCDYNFTKIEGSTSMPAFEDSGRSFHHVSYLYYMPLGAIMTCLSAVLFSCCFGFENPKNVDPQLLAPVVRKYFKSKTLAE